MTIKNVTIDGVSYPAIISTRTMMQLEADENNLTDIMNEIGAGKTKPMIYLLSLMLDAGYHWMLEESEDAIKPPSVESIISHTGIHDYSRMRDELSECITASISREVEVEEDKKKAKRTTSQAK